MNFTEWLVHEKDSIKESHKHRKLFSVRFRVADN